MMGLATWVMPQAKVRLGANRVFGGDGVVVFLGGMHDAFYKSPTNYFD